MNWLAHLHLASMVQADPASSLLPDIINTRHLHLFTPTQQYAIQVHQTIDRFTDQHPQVKQSKQRITPPFQRFAGVLIDIFYDYCLCQSWELYDTERLSTFTNQTYAQLAHSNALPPPAPAIIELLITQDWLGSYQTVEGIELSLKRISRRFKRPIDLAPAINNLKLIEKELMQDFNQFYPELITHVQLSAKDLSFHNLN
ncbi:ACP phosphodiesterase [Thiofilum flexile]|uniref:acyl carrier protein phosphodiesterase n=1 Tax=Thiofilum flexile TaxID=125627 RepID=UPI000475D504|nr:acyl carrier protein phosphodiesterase [Thiofilum flexile]